MFGMERWSTSVLAALGVGFDTGLSGVLALVFSLFLRGQGLLDVSLVFLMQSVTATFSESQRTQCGQEKSASNDKLFHGSAFQVVPRYVA